MSRTGSRCTNIYGAGWRREGEEADIGGNRSGGRTDLPVSEIIGFMEELKKEGKIRFYGASNFPRKRMDEAVRYAGENGIQGFSAVSNQWSIASVNPGKNLNQDRTLVMTDAAYQRWHEKTGIPLIPFSSGAQGFFSRLERAGVQAKGGAVVREGELSLIP